MHCRPQPTSTVLLQILHLCILLESPTSRGYRHQYFLYPQLTPSNTPNIDSRSSSPAEAKYPQTRCPPPTTRTEPCTCGLAEEVARLQKNLQIYIDNGPNSKKGNQQKLYKMENQRLTSVVTEQKKQINGLLAKIKRQDSEIERLRRKSGESENAQPVVPVARQPSMSFEQVTLADPAGYAAPRGNQRECIRH